MERQVVIKNLPEALRVVKEMKLASDEWTGEYRDAARHTIAAVLKEQMEEQVARHLAWVFQKGIPDRRNGSYLRHVLTELGNVILAIPRTRRFIPHGIIAAMAPEDGQQHPQKGGMKVKGPNLQEFGIPSGSEKYWYAPSGRIEHFVAHPPTHGTSLVLPETWYRASGTPSE